MGGRVWGSSTRHPAGHHSVGVEQQQVGLKTNTGNNKAENKGTSKTCNRIAHKILKCSLLQERNSSLRNELAHFGPVTKCYSMLSSMPF